MEAFRWDSCFLTGLPTVDEQHKYLVDLINQFGDLLMRPEGASADQVERLIGELKRYTIYHFQEEEALMRSKLANSPHVRAHELEHARFLQDVNHLHADVTGDNQQAATALLNYLSNWLAFHILGTDRLMAALLHAKASGESLRDAYNDFQRHKDPATAALLHAMGQLVAQVSERSRALADLNQTLEARVERRTHALSTLNQRLESMAMTDVLTELPNRRHAMLVLDREWRRSGREDAALACLMIDVDGFKQVNDGHGHDAGDAVLIELAKCLRSSVRGQDVVCRLGGDEFLIVSPAAPLEGALHMAEKLRTAVASLRVDVGGAQWLGSVSIGVAVMLPTHQRMEDLLKDADRGAYQAKVLGRNRVACAQISDAPAFA